MKAVIQRVTRASVEVEGRTVGAIGLGLLVLLGIAKGDGEADCRFIVEKLRGLRIFADDAGKMNRSLDEVGGAILLVSQFTLLGNTRSGRRPGFEDAAPPEEAKRLYEAVSAALKTQGTAVESGVFAAHMKVALVNDGPVTFVLDSRSGISAVS
jgi:D-tyrosyl-tRNA(Tyr) deacylase